MNIGEKSLLGARCDNKGGKGDEDCEKDRCGTTLSEAVRKTGGLVLVCRLRRPSCTIREKGLTRRGVPVAA